MATATLGTAVFTGAQSRKTYVCSVYTADTAAYKNRFNRAGAATAATEEYLVFDEDVILTDFSIKTGTTQTSAKLTESGRDKDGGYLDYVVHVSTNSNRPRLVIPFKKGAMIGITTI